MGHGEHAEGKKLVNLWLTESERAAFKQTAAELGISVSDVIRTAYEHFRAEQALGKLKNIKPKKEGNK